MPRPRRWFEAATARRLAADMRHPVARQNALKLAAELDAQAEHSETKCKKPKAAPGL
jgi:hypothetical protein